MKPYTLDADNYVLKISGMGYLAHPFGRLQSNRAKARKIQFALLNRFPSLVLINGIDNASTFFGRSSKDDFFQWDETAILQKDFQIIDHCDVFILCKGWEESCGCRAEWAYATARGIPILCVETRYEDELSENIELFELSRNFGQLEERRDLNGTGSDRRRNHPGGQE